MSKYSRNAVLLSVLLCGQVQAEDFPLMDCVITPSATAEVSTPVTGVIETMNVVRSDYVTSGQIIAQLDAHVERATVELAEYRSTITSPIHQARIKQKFEQKDRKRAADLYLSKAASEHDDEVKQRDAELSRWKLQDAYDQLRQRELELTRAVKNLEQKTIRSPIDGYVVQRYKNPGEYVEDQPLVRVATLDPLHIEAIVPMSFFGQIEGGLAAYIYPETAAEDEQFIAHVDIVDAMGDAASGTFGARLKLANPDSRIPAGQKCNIRFLDRNSKHSKVDEYRNRVKKPSGSISPEVPVVATDTINGLPDDTPVIMSETSKVVEESMHQVPATSQRAPLASCYTAGPFPDRKQVNTLVDRLGDTVTSSVRPDNRSETVIGYIVLSQKYTEVDYNLTRHFKESGVKNLVYLGKGPYAGRLSLGVYKGEKDARRRSQQLAARGLKSIVEPRTRSVTSYWLDMNYLDTAQVSLVTSLDLPESTSLTTIECGLLSQNNR
ncbi:MAG: efflux RND transporter periplasmic adaptor subunit [Gammaproteobacteria bacterium]|nr:efflux RND transporter periplasmic adaptor subunit [Gammaproteobacteria bacterium]